MREISQDATRNYGSFFDGRMETFRHSAACPFSLMFYGYFSV